MALFNYASKEITLKVVYYGPGLSGKTTNLQNLHENLEQARQSKLLSLATETDRTLFFDFLPMDLGTIGGFKVKFQMYTVPGQVRYDATRKLVLKGADAVVFVADSQPAMRDSNMVSFENMEENLQANNLDPRTILLVLQYNKRDLPDIMSVEEMNQDLNRRNGVHFEAVAVNGVGVMETFNEITRLLVEETSRRQKLYAEGRSKTSARAIQTKVGPAKMGVLGGTRKPPARTTRPGAEPLYEANSFKGAPAEESLLDSPLERNIRAENANGAPAPGDNSGMAGSVSEKLTVFMEESRRRDEQMIRVLQEILTHLKKA